MRLLTGLYFAAGALVVLGLARPLPIGDNAMAASSDDRLPIRQLVCYVEKESRLAFFEGLRIFADLYAFAIRISPNSPDGEHFVIQMYRLDVEVFGNSSYDSGRFKIAFYRRTDSQPPEELLNSMVGEINKIALSSGGIRCE